MTRWRIPEKRVPKVKVRTARISQAKGQRIFTMKDSFLWYLYECPKNYSSDFLILKMTNVQPNNDTKIIEEDGINK